MPGYLAYKVYKGLWAGLDWVYPPVCAGCGKKGTRWCPTCAEQSYGLLQNICERCGAPQFLKTSTCGDCRANLPSYLALRSWGVFQGSLRKAIHRLKYRRDVSLGEILVRPVIPWLQSFNWKIDLIVPVPMSLARLSERGYNQTSLIAWPLALGIAVPCRPSALRKVKETYSQVGLTGEQRRTNVVDAFQARRRWVEKKNVLIVDDVATTGATMDACAASLLAAGASEIYGLTLARSGE